jgi:hypothetical protein
MERTFDCPESGDKCNRPDCSIKYCADRKDLETRATARAFMPACSTTRSTHMPGWSRQGR